MADQGRWFKLWVSAPSDDDIQALPSSLRWAWAAFGAYTKFHGTRGVVQVSPQNSALASEMGVPLEHLIDTLRRLPHLTIEEGKRANGSAVVTWHNWRKYQEDSTISKRVHDLRSKRRGEEKRREENKKREEKDTTRRTPHGVLADTEFLAAIKTNPAYRGIDIDLELAKMDAWLLTPRGRGKKKTRGRIIAWLNGAVERLPVQPEPDPPYGVIR